MSNTGKDNAVEIQGKGLKMVDSSGKPAILEADTVVLAAVDPQQRTRSRIARAGSRNVRHRRLRQDGKVLDAMTEAFDTAIII